MKHVFASAGAATLLLALAAQMPALAQATNNPTQTKPADLPVLTGEIAPKDRTVAVRVRNMRPDLMAYWIDPAHTPLPPGAVPIPIQNDEVLAQAKQTVINGPGGQKNIVSLLPPGVKQIIAVNPQNIILAIGTDEGVAEVQKLVELLDQPVKQAEVEVQVVQIENDDVKKLLSNAPNLPKASPTMHISGVFIAAPNWMSSFSQLVNAKKATIFSAPRITAINKAPATLSLTMGQNDAALMLEDALEGRVPRKAAPGADFQVKATLNDDETNTIEYAITRGATTPAGKEPTAIPQGESRAMLTARDGDTLIIVGKTASWFNPTAPKPDAPVALFVKVARIKTVPNKQ